MLPSFQYEVHFISLTGLHALVQILLYSLGEGVGASDFSDATKTQTPGSCFEKCGSDWWGSQDESENCGCYDECLIFGDCCDDFEDCCHTPEYCGSEKLQKIYIEKYLKIPDGYDFPDISPGTTGDIEDSSLVPQDELDGCRQCSRKTCEQLGLDAASIGFPLVCGESDFIYLGGFCSGQVTWQEAKEFCENGGMRLCTQEELVADETADTSCGYDTRLVWTSTSCLSEDGFYMAVEGQNGEGAGEAELCTEQDNSDQRYARCCADVRDLPIEECCAPDCVPGRECCDYTTECCDRTGRFQNDRTSCDNGIFCDGADICEANVCVSPGNPCPTGQFCSTASDSCEFCESDVDCDDGIFCNGVETCAASTCIIGGDPCYPNDGECLESSSSCTGPPCTICSTKICTDISGHVNTNQNEVCAKSDFEDCRAVTFQDAFEVCEAEGARLCTFPEVQAGEAAGSGCSVDGNIIWTSTPCATTDEYRIANGDGTAATSNCLAFYENAHIACCADTDNTGSSCCAPQNDDAPTRPNILLIIVDDMGYHDIGFAESPVNGFENDISSPQIDSLKNDSIVLTNYYTQMTCTPTRVALMTGRNPLEFGVQDVFQPIQEIDLVQKLNVTFLSQRMKSLGYDTHMIGKWHLGYRSWDETPIGRGFDSFYGFFLGSEKHFSHLTRGARSGRCNGEPYSVESNFGAHHWFYDENVGPSDEGIPLKDIIEDKYSTDLYGQRVVDIINERSQSGDPDPFFIEFSLSAVHSPWEVPFKYYNDPACQLARETHSEERAILCGMVLAIDKWIGHILGNLTSAGYDDNTVIIFSSDNGAQHNMTGNFGIPAGSNAPLRSGKATYYEGGAKSRGFIHAPDHFGWPKGNYNELFHISDWFLTFQSMARSRDGVPLDPVPSFRWAQQRDSQDSRTTKTSFNQWNKIVDPQRATPRPEMIYTVKWADGEPVDRGAVRDGDYKLIFGANTLARDGWWDESCENPPVLLCSNFRTDRRLGIPSCDDQRETLFFKISEDPEERTNDGNGLDIGDLTGAALTAYNYLQTKFSDWQDFVKPHISEGVVFDAQGYAELWNCTFRPYVGVEIPLSGECSNPNRTVTICQNFGEDDEWKCPACWPGMCANQTDCSN